MLTNKEAVNDIKKCSRILHLGTTKNPLKKKNKKISHINWEVALHDVKDIICKNLNLKDLCNLSKLNTSWRYAALHEKVKRPYIRRSRLSYDLANPSKSPTSTLANVVKVNPFVSLLIHDGRLEKSLGLDETSVKEKLLDDFEKSLSHNVITLKVNECISTDDVELNDMSNIHFGAYSPSNQYRIKDTVNSGLFGLFFPSAEQQTRVRVAWEPKGDFNELPSVAVDRLAKKLSLDDREHPSVLLLFVAPRVCRAFTLADILRERIDQNKETIWLGEIGGKITASSNNDGEDRYTDSDQVIMALRISGPRVKSWTASIDLRWPWATVQRKLYELKDRVTPNRYCTALLAGPCNSPYGTGQDIVHDVKRIFPGIPFVGLFDNHRLSPFELGKRSFQWSREYTCMSIVIISYDN